MFPKSSLQFLVFLMFCSTVLELLLTFYTRVPPPTCKAVFVVHTFVAGICILQLSGMIRSSAVYTYNSAGLYIPKSTLQQFSRRLLQEKLRLFPSKSVTYKLLFRGNAGTVLDFSTLKSLP